MKRFMNCIRMVCMLLVCTMITHGVMTADVSAAETVMFFVATDGSDTNDGSISAPFATIEKAKEAIKALSFVPEGGVVVNLREGEYKIDRSVNFTQADSGREGAPIVYRGYNNEKVVLSGSENLCWEKFENLSDPDVLNKIPEGVRSDIIQMDLSFVKTNMGELHYLDNERAAQSAIWSELVFDGEIMDVARYPNKDEYLEVGSIKSKGSGVNDGAEWAVFDSELAKLAGEKNIWAVGWFKWYWMMDFEKIENIGTSPSTIKLEYPINEISQGHPYYLENAPQMIDAPNEYYIDRDKKMLYFYPAKDVQNVKVELTSLTDNMITMNNVSHIIFQNLTLENGRSNAIDSTNCTDIIVDNCLIKNFGVSGANFWGSKDCQVVNSEIYNIGNRAVNVEAGNAETLTSGGFRLVNNEIHKLGRINKMQASAIWTHGYNGGTVGTYIAHNKMYDVPMQCITSGIESIIEYNEIYDAANECADMGAIYVGGSLSQQGNIIRYNYIHDIPCVFENTGYGTNGIYLDIDAGYYKIYGNVVANVHRNFYYSSNGSYSEFYNNVFVGDRTSKSIKEFPVSAQTIRIESSGIKAPKSEIMGRIKGEYTYTNDLWTSKYPMVKEAVESEFPLAAAHMIERNVMYNAREMAIAEEVYDDPRTSVKDNWIGSTDPGFVDLANGNYQLRADAPVLAQVPGFEIIDMSKIGLLDTPVDIGAPTGIGTGVTPDVPPGETSSGSVPEADASILQELGTGVALKIGSPAAALKGKKVYVDDRNTAIAPFIENDRTLVPVRFVSEALGARVGWKESTKEIAIVMGDRFAIMQLGSNIVRLDDGSQVTFDVPVKETGGRTFVPIRALGELLNKSFFWDNRGIVIMSDTADKEYSDSLISFLIRYLD
ncbi:MAG: hypothetical protein J6N52_00195 [Clostridia bacterium]|nr:hypothetical protein [Clostridia bacterium]